MFVKIKNLCTSPIRIEIKQGGQVMQTETIEVESDIQAKVPMEKGTSLLLHVTGASNENLGEHHEILKNVGAFLGNAVLGDGSPTFKESLEDKKVIYIENISDEQEEAEILIMYSKDDHYFGISKDKRIRVRQRYDIGKDELKKRLRDWYISCGVVIALYLAVLVICTIVAFVKMASSKWLFLIMTVVCVTIPMRHFVKDGKRDCIEIGRRRLIGS